MISSSQALKVLLVGISSSSTIPTSMDTLGWSWESVPMDSWFNTTTSGTWDAAVLDMTSSRSPDAWLRIHHLVSRVQHPLVLVSDGPVPSSFHYPRGGGLRVALLPSSPHPDLLRSTVNLVRQIYQTVRVLPETEDGEELLEPDWERRDAVLASVRRIQQELAAVQSLLDPEQASGPIQPLGDRELEVHTLLLKGLSIGAIGDRLGIAESTVKKHVHAIYRKRGVSNRAQLMAAE